MWCIGPGEEAGAWARVLLVLRKRRRRRLPRAPGEAPGLAALGPLLRGARLNTDLELVRTRGIQLFN